MDDRGWIEQPITALPDASSFELAIFTFALTALVINGYSIYHAAQVFRRLSHLSGARAGSIMAWTQLRGLLFRFVLIVALLCYSSYAMSTRPLVLPIPTITRFSSGVHVLVAFVIALSGVLEIVERSTAYRAAERARRGEIDTNIDAVIIIDTESTIKGANAAATRLLGYEEWEMIGSSMTRYMPERYRTAHKDGIARYLKSGRSAILGRAIIVEALHKDGTELSVELIITEARGVNGSQFKGILRPIHEPEPDAALRAYDYAISTQNHGKEQESGAYHTSDRA